MMKNKRDIFQWIKSEMTSRGWSIRELARQMNMSGAAISDMLSYEKTPSLETCKALARVFGKTDIFVLVLAGHIDEPQGWAPEDEEMRALFSSLTTEDRRVLIATGRALHEERKYYDPTK